MERTTIQYGGAPLELLKSPELIAIKPYPGIESTFLRAVPALTAGRDDGRSLAGFRLLRLGPGLARTEIMLDAARLDDRVQVGSHVYHTSDDGVPFVPTGELCLEFTKSSTIQTRQALINRHALEWVEAKGDGVFLVRTTSKSTNPVKVAADLFRSSAVRVAEPIFATPRRLLGFALPDDKLLTEQWHLRNVGFHRGTNQGFKKGADARVVEAWEIAASLGDPSVVVAVIDDGFDLQHDDLGADGKVVAPWDFTRLNDRPLPSDGDWHGTACAGVAVGSANGSGILGAAPGCSLMPVRFSGHTPLAVESWFDYVTANGAAVVSCSWSSKAKYYPLCKIEKDAITRCATAGRGGLGCVVCFAAGNESRDVNDPAGESVNGYAAHPQVMAIAACTSMDEKAHDSNIGDEISVCAPSSGAGGWRVTTSDVTGQYLDAFGMTRDRGYSPGPYTNMFEGTSSSCALVAGVAALVLSARPDLTSAEVRQVLERNARQIGPEASYGPNGHSKEFGFGRVDAAKALSSLLPIP